MKRILILGATSGIGLETARAFLRRGWHVGAAGRNVERLASLQESAPGQVTVGRIDLLDPQATDQLLDLIERMGGCDVLLNSAGIGYNNPALDPTREIDTARTNVEGFTRIMTAAYRYFRQQGGGHLADISSIAGTKGLGAAPAYSASKRYQNTYLDALAQLAHMEHLSLHITDIRPGFVDTPLLREGNYPMLLSPEKVAERIARAILHKRRRIVIDRRYALMVFFWRLLPQWIWERLTVKTKS